ncbi:MAG TPA: type I secretion system permease/ATPase [Methylomirabilota bacterium]|nr:type I secretion system permease/ATPase [Methylomirabilota bacterium]
MDAVPKAEPRADGGLVALAVIARYHGLSTDVESLRQRFALGDGSLPPSALLRAARAVGLRARMVKVKWPRLSMLPLPAAALQSNGQYAIVIRADESRALIQEPGSGQLRVLARDEFQADWSGRLLLFARRQGSAEGEGRFGLAWFIPFIAHYRAQFTQVLLASAFLHLFSIVGPLATQVVIDKVLVHRGLGTLDVVALGMLALILFEGVLGGLRAYLFAHTGSRIDVELGICVFRHALGLPLGYFEARRAGDTVARIGELEGVRRFLTGPPLTAMLDGALTGVFLGVMFLYSVSLTLLVIAFLPVYVLMAIIVTPLLRRAVDERSRRGAEAHAFLVESIRGIETIKAMAVESLLERRWDEHVAGLARSGFRAGQIAQIAGQAATVLSKLTALGILWIGARGVLAGDLTVGELIAFNMLAGRVAAPVLRLVQLWQEWQQASVAVTRLADLLDAPTERPVSTASPMAGRIRGRVEFEKVTFAYRPGQTDVLREVSFAAGAGEIVGIVGASGSGKSTIAKLATRLYLPQRGRVLLDGVDVALADPFWLRRCVVVVPQDTMLFSGSVRDNVAWADPGMPLDAVIRATRLSGAHEFIMDLPQGYDTPVGEHGALLSGGQRQRIGIARALAMRPSVLILDEATSGLDYEAERVIDANLGAICGGRTVFIIAHRLTLVRRAHRIIALAAGRVIEQGSPAELLASNGYFATLEREQRGEINGSVRRGMGSKE